MEADARRTPDVEHPDDGMIHAWLDGALDASAAASIATHVRGCPECTERVAEARGLIAGASRLVRALDDGDAPSVAPLTVDAIRDAAPGSAWRLLRVTPARAALAASLILAVGITLTRRQVAPERQQLQTAASAAGADTAQRDAMQGDALLDSAIRRNIASAQPPRAIAAAPGPTVPIPDAPPAPQTLADPRAGERVAEARMAVAADRESSATKADKVRAGPGAAAGLTAGVPGEQERSAFAARRAEIAAPSARPEALPSAPGSASCIRIERGQGTGALDRWGTTQLPFTVELRGGDGGIARVLGEGEAVRGTWTRDPSDTIRIALRRADQTGLLALSPGASVRVGTMRSASTSPTAQSRGTDAMATAGSPVVARPVSCVTR